MYRRAARYFLLIRRCIAVSIEHMRRVTPLFYSFASCARYQAHRSIYFFGKLPLPYARRACAPLRDNTPKIFNNNQSACNIMSVSKTHLFDVCYNVRTPIVASLRAWHARDIALYLRVCAPACLTRIARASGLFCISTPRIARTSALGGCDISLPRAFTAHASAKSIRQRHQYQRHGMHRMEEVGMEGT